MVGIFFVFGIISYVLTFNYEDVIENQEIGRLTEGEDEEKTETKKEENKEEKEKINGKKILRKVTYKDLFKVFISKKNLQMLVFIASGPCK